MSVPIACVTPPNSSVRCCLSIRPSRTPSDRRALTRARATPSPSRLYITMDGVLAHLHERGWSEIKVGCCYQAQAGTDRTRPELLEIRAHSTSYVSALEESQSFRCLLLQEARGQLVLTWCVLGDVRAGTYW